MPIDAGTRLGPYEVVAPIGAGGMGEVYRAADTRLGRDVALKLLPEAFAADPDRLARFEREAKVLSISGNRSYYLPSPDGKRFLVNALVSRENEPGLRVILNWNPPTGVKP